LDQNRPIERVPVDLAVLAADACSDAVAAAPGRSVALDAPEPVVILGDRDHLRQAIGNLVANALRHTPAGTPVEVSARIEGRAPFRPATIAGKILRVRGGATLVPGVTPCNRRRHTPTRRWRSWSGGPPTTGWRWRAPPAGSWRPGRLPPKGGTVSSASWPRP